MPFVTEAYLKYLEQQMQRASGTVAGGESALPPPDLPTPAPTEPSMVPNNLPPGQGGPGSYPAGGPTPNEGGYPIPIQLPSPTPSPSAVPVSYDPNTPTPDQWGPNTSFVPMPVAMSPGAPNDVAPLPTGGVTPNDLVNPPANLPPGTPPPPTSGPMDYPPATPAPPMPTGRGVGYNPAGVNLSINDRINMILNSLGLPPLPAGYDPTGGLPAGFTEGNRFGGGAPVFTGPGDFGPNFSPGGSIFGGRGLPIVPGSTAGPGNLGGGGGMLSSPWQFYEGTRSPAFLAWMAANGINRHDATRMFETGPSGAAQGGPGHVQATTSTQ